MNKFLPFLFLVFSVSLSYGQIDATTSEGKHVLLNEDGTWEYARGKAEPVGNTAPDKAPVASGLCDYKTNEIDYKYQSFQMYNYMDCKKNTNLDL